MRTKMRRRRRMTPKMRTKKKVKRFVSSRLVFLFLLFRSYASTRWQEEDEDMEEIDPTAIVGRRTRGKKVDYTSEEALNKAGLKKEDMETDE
jgi:hypothetical protein